jgi:hypothetical protein
MLQNKWSGRLRMGFALLRAVSFSYCKKSSAMFDFEDYFMIKSMDENKILNNII